MAIRKQTTTTTVEPVELVAPVVSVEPPSVVPVELVAPVVSVEPPSVVPVEPVAPVVPVEPVAPVATTTLLKSTGNVSLTDRQIFNLMAKLNNLHLAPKQNGRTITFPLGDVAQMMALGACLRGYIGYRTQCVATNTIVTITLL